MVRPAVIFVVCGLLFAVRAAASPAPGCDSPAAVSAAADSLAVAPSDPDTLAKRRSFFGRIIDYFGKSTVDRTFDKKIDITFAGGPSYSKTTSLGIGVLAAGL